MSDEFWLDVFDSCTNEATVDEEICRMLEDWEYQPTPANVEKIKPGIVVALAEHTYGYVQRELMGDALHRIDRNEHERLPEE